MDKKKRIYIYKKTHLPKNGWLHGCFMCNKITGQTKEYINNNEEKLIYICYECDYMINKSKEMKKEYIREHVSFFYILTPKYY